jgi:AcrR family transcriptional regulator
MQTDPNAREKNKALTMRKLVEAVATIFQTEGYAGLGVNKVAKIAGVHKKLIYRYFGDFDGLVEAYILETDYWMQFSAHLRELTVPKDMEGVRRLLTQVLQNQFLYFQSNKEMQALIIWELSTGSVLMRSIHRMREEMGQQLLVLTDPYLTAMKNNFRAVAALLVGGIYYTILHTRFNGGTFSAVDLKSEQGRQDILEAIDFIVSANFDST